MNLKRNFLTVVSLIALAAPVQSFAFPKAPFDALKTNLKSVEALDPKYDFNGIVKLSNCSGSIVKFSGMPTTAKAIVMTNGHCVQTGVFGGMIKPNQVIFNQSTNRAMRVYNNKDVLVGITATKLLYATMTLSDVAYYELSDSYDSLKSKGVDFFDLDTDRPVMGLGIQIVSGYWDRGYECQIDGFVFTLKEAGYIFKDSIRYTSTGCNTIGGTSGSPIIETGKRVVIGINNTGNESGGRCTMNNPCEEDEAGTVTVKAKASYGQQTFQTYSCLTPDFRIDLKKSGCELFKGE